MNLPLALVGSCPYTSLQPKFHHTLFPLPSQHTFVFSHVKLHVINKASCYLSPLSFTQAVSLLACPFPLCPPLPYNSYLLFRTQLLFCFFLKAFCFYPSHPIFTYSGCCVFFICFPGLPLSQALAR